MRFSRLVVTLSFRALGGMSAACAGSEVSSNCVESFGALDLDSFRLWTTDSRVWFWILFTTFISLPLLRSRIRRSNDPYVVGKLTKPSYCECL